MGLAPDIVAAIAQRLAEHAGLELPPWVVDARATARIAELGCSAGDYVELIDSVRGAAELGELVEAVRVGESRLFRHRPQIDALAEVVAPALRARGRRAIRVWSAGCAAGEEPYTLALVLSRALPDCTISIIATDVSADALALAAAARYARAALQHVPEPYRDRFVGDGDWVRVAPEVAALVRFERANLLDGAAPRGCDVVWCRNVLIYFTADARRRAIERLVGATVPGGVVFVGYSESLRDVEELDAVRANEAVYYVRREAGEPPRRRSPTPYPSPSPSPSPYLSPSPSPYPSPSAMPMPSPTAVADRRAPMPSPTAVADRRTPSPLPTAVADRRSPSPLPTAVADRRTPLPLPVPTAVADDRTPPPMLFPPDPPADDTLVLRGHPIAARVTAELSARLAQPGLRSLTIDFDGADLVGDDLAPVLRRARAAAGTAGIALLLRASRPGARRWLARHGLDDQGGAP